MIGFPCAIILVFCQSTAMVEVEEAITTCSPPGNGAGPFWCYGAPLLLRLGDDVFVSAMETGEDVEPLCNTRWRIFRKHGQGKWEMVQTAAEFKEREPCPIIGFQSGKIFLSTNPSTQPPGTKYGPCDPHLLEFSGEDPSKPGIPVYASWDEGSVFTDHSYRGIAADGSRGEILALNIHARSGEQFWSFRDANGEWSRYGRIRFPIRSCYPQVALKDRSAHVLAIGDIVEPVKEWQAYKFEKSGRQWDYVFRRLFYTYAADITKSDFVEPIEVDNLDATAGHIRNLDLWIDAEGSAHILYLKQTVQSKVMRDRFFPDVAMNTSLEYMVIRDGKIVKRSTLLKGGEGASDEIPGNARFHITGDGNLFVIYYCGGRDSKGNAVSENRLLQILPEIGKPIRLEFEKPFGMFFTATERGGSAPSDVIDLFGSGRSSQELRYARIRLR